MLHIVLFGMSLVTQPDEFSYSLHAELETALAKAHAERDELLKDVENLCMQVGNNEDLFRVSETYPLMKLLRGDKRLLAKQH